MKRSLLSALILCVIVSAIVIVLHMHGWLMRAEVFAMSLLSSRVPATTYIGERIQFPLVVLLSFGVVFATLATTRRQHLRWVLLALALELIAATWVGSLYHLSFQPLLALLAVVLGFLAATALAALGARTPSARPAKRIKTPVSRPKIAMTAPAIAPQNLAAKAFEVTAVVCDLADKHDLAEECEPDVYARITEKFLAHATDTFIRAGAYIEAASGEGVVAIFGFPNEYPEHAEQATREAMGLVESFTDLPEESKLGGSQIGVHAGVSSGRIVAASLKTDDGVSMLLTTGEPVELARRFCIANRFYGSRVLIGPRTFELASKTLVARPIDFLSGVDVRERHEIYEPISLAVDASPEEIMRRDEFWNGVVLYREKRWAEAYSHFQKARRPDREIDAPLQLYLRRLEPLALQLTNTPLDE